MKRSQESPTDYAKDAFIQQITADYREHLLGWKSVFAYNKAPTVYWAAHPTRWK